MLCAFQQIWTCVLCKKKQEILVKTGQWYHGSMAKPVTLDMDLGSDASSIKTDSSSMSDKRFSEGGPGPGSGMARTLPPEGGGGGIYGGPQPPPMGGPVVPGYDPSRSGLPGSNAAVTVGNEFGARPTPNGALGQTMVDPSGRRMVDQNGRMIAPETGARQATDTSGRPLFDAAGKPLMDQSSRPMVDPSGRPMIDSTGRPMVDISGRPVIDQPPGRPSAEQGRPVANTTGRPVVDQSVRPPTEQAGRPLVDSTGRPLLDFAGNPIMDYSGRQLPDSTSRTTTDHSIRPPGAAGYPDTSRHPAIDQSGRPVLDQTGRPVMDHPGASGRPLTDATGRPLPDSGTIRLPDHAVRGANDLGYGTTTTMERGSQPKLDPAGRPMFDSSGRMIMEPIPVEQSHQAPVDPTGKTIVDPHLGPIGDIHSRGAAPMESSFVDAPTQRFDARDRPSQGDVRQDPDSMRRTVPEQRGLDTSLSAGMSTEPRGRMLPDIESRTLAGPSVQDWRGDGPRSLGTEGWPKDRLPGPVQEPPGMGQRGGVEGQPAAAWQGKESDPAITTAQQRPQPPRHVPGEPWRQQPGPQRYAT